MSSIDDLASYRRGIQRIHGAWPAFREKRRDRLAQQRRHGVAAERVAENILGNSTAVYVQLEEVLRQLGRLDEVLGG